MLCKDTECQKNVYGLVWPLPFGVIWSCGQFKWELIVGKRRIPARAVRDSPGFSSVTQDGPGGPERSCRQSCTVQDGPGNPWRFRAVQDCPAGNPVRSKTVLQANLDGPGNPGRSRTVLQAILDGLGRSRQSWAVQEGYASNPGWSRQSWAVQEGTASNPGRSKQSWAVRACQIGPVHRCIYSCRNPLREHWKSPWSVRTFVKSLYAPWLEAHGTATHYPPAMSRHDEPISMMTCSFRFPLSGRYIAHCGYQCSSSNLLL